MSIINKKVLKAQTGSVVEKQKKPKGLPINKIPDGFGDPNESPNRYMLRLYSAPRIKLMYETPENKKMREDAVRDITYNREMLSGWDALAKEWPDVFDDDYKKIINSLISFDLEKLKQSPTNTILGIRLNLKDNANDPSLLGYIRREEPIVNVFPYKHKDTELYSTPSTYVHEMTHKLEDLTTNEIIKTRPESYFAKTSKGVYDRLSDSETNYYASPTEKAARVNELRYNLDKLKLYDATKRDFTELDYDKMIKLNNPIINRILHELQKGSLERIGKEFRNQDPKLQKKNIILLMNEVAENKNNKVDIDIARRGIKLNTLIKYRDDHNKISKR